LGKNRGHGEGTIWQMPDGRWRGEVSVGWRHNEHGQSVWKRKTVSAKTRGEVADKLKKLLRDQQRGLNIDPNKQTVAEFLTAWLEDTVKPSVRPKTYRSYEQMVRCHLVKNLKPEEIEQKGLDNVSSLGALPLAKLTLQVVQRWLNDKLKAGNSPSLVSDLRTVLRAAMAYAVRDDLLPRNTAALARPPRVVRREVAPFNPEQAGSFLKAAVGHRLEALFTCALAVGLRSGEASALRWQEDVDLEAGQVTVHHTLQRQKGTGLALMPPKSEKGRRTIELPSVCVAILKRHRQNQVLERQLAGSRWQETGHVFVSTIGTPIDDRKVLREFDAIVKAAGLPKQRFHDLRHAAITLLGAQGVPLKVIAEIVGHSDIRLTQNVYQHVFQPAKREAADKMNDLLTEVTGKAGKNRFATGFATMVPLGKAN